ncbi:MAG: YggT family protein [Candidatus Tokpelaia sp. JSC188]|nr:MAG: YggT family protein [Candidatus Tokpelaia sp. JSC188]
MYALFSTIDLALQTYTCILIANAIFSWLCAFNIINQHNQAIRIISIFLYQTTEPVLRSVRRVLPNLGAIDISPIVLFLIIYFIQIFMWRTIYPMVS